jgi:hypothetical protein
MIFIKVSLWTLLLAFALPVSAQDFVLPSQADMLLVVHSTLRTPGWYAGMPGAWETALLSQKQQQGISVAVLHVTDGENQFDIRDSILSQAAQIRYLFIVGDAKRPRTAPWCGEDWWDPRTETSEEDYPVADAAGGNFVPAWYFPQFLHPRWGWDGWDWATNDKHYADGIANCLVGRLPAESRDEILAYVNKSGEHLLADPSAPWTHRITFAGDDVYFSYNGVPGEWTIRYQRRWVAHLSPAWTVDTLFTSEYQLPGQDSVRFDLFESRFNDGRAIVTGYGPRAAAWRFVNWYDDTELCDWEFYNQGQYPLVIGASCDLGGYDEWWYPYEAVGCEGTPHEHECIVERLLVLPNGGCIAALASTGSTSSHAAAKWAECCFIAVGEENVHNYALVGKRATELAWPYYDDLARCHYERFQLLGDPSLSLPGPPLIPLHFTVCYVSETGELSFRWQPCGAVEYRVYSAPTPDGPFNDLVGTATGGTLVVPMPSYVRRFFVVRAAN